MNFFKIKINDEAFSDILEITAWYNDRVPGLGLRFQKNIKKQITALKNNAYSYSIRYHDVRCSVVKKFPFLIHYIIDEANETIDVFAIIHTSRNPKIWEQKSENI
jgi:plasmid stabilization system protein ParE